MRIPGFELDFPTELSAVRFREHVSPMGMGVAVGHLIADGQTKLWADVARGYLCIIRILSAAKQQAEYTLVPFTNVAFFRTVPPPVAARPAPKRAEVPA